MKLSATEYDGLRLGRTQQTGARAIAGPLCFTLSYSAPLCASLRPSDRPPLPVRRFRQAQARPQVVTLLFTPRRQQLTAEHDEHTGHHDRCQRFGHGHLADVRVDGAVEGQLLGQRVHERQRVLDMRAHQRLFGARLRQPHAAVGRRRQLAGEERFGKDVVEHD
jgi:hypothetical protein